MHGTRVTIRIITDIILRQSLPSFAIPLKTAITPFNHDHPLGKRGITHYIIFVQSADRVEGHGHRGRVGQGAKTGRWVFQRV